MKALALAFAAGLAVIGPQDPPAQTFRTATHAVTVDVAVILRDNVVNWLKPEDFELYDDGVRQTLTSVERSKLPIDLRLVFDTSSSINDEGLERYRRAMRRVADSLQPDDRCEILTFARRVTTAAVPQSPPVAIDLRRPQPDGTSFIDAVAMALVKDSSQDWRRIIIVLSDAQDNASFLDEADLLDAARRTDAVVYTVLPTQPTAATSPHVARLEALSLLTGGRLVPSYYDALIGSILIDAINEFRNSYVLRYTLHGTIKPGWHKLTVKVHGDQKYTVRARPGYFIGR